MNDDGASGGVENRHRMAEIDTYVWMGKFEDLSPHDRLAAAVLVVDGKAVVGNVDEIAGRLGRRERLR